MFDDNKKSWVLAILVIVIVGVSIIVGIDTLVKARILRIIMTVVPLVLLILFALTPLQKVLLNKLTPVPVKVRKAETTLDEPKTEEKNDTS